MKKRLAAMAIATSLTPALAEVPAWEYGGTVHSIFGGNTLPMGDFFSLNEPVAVAVAIESGQTDTCADAVYGCYSTGIIKARVGDNLLTFASGTLVVSDNYNDLQDTFSVRASTISDLFGTPVNVDFELSGVDFSMTALNNDQMPMNADAISLFGSRDTKLIFQGSSSETVMASVDRWRNLAEQPPISPVPEPEAYAMWIVGFSVMGLMARRRKCGKV